ncbi:MAG: magnesium transporter [Pseudomonadota bacterium]
MAEPQSPQGNSDSAAQDDPSLVRDISDAIETADQAELSRRLGSVHPADAADALEQLGRDDFEGAVALLGGELPADILIELRDEYREDAVEALPDDAVSAAIDALDSDDAATILQDVDAARRDRILEAVSPADRAVLEQGLTFGEDTAGRLMQREFVAAPEFWTVGDAIDKARDTGKALPAQFYEIYVVDPAMHVLGCVPLSMLFRTGRDALLVDIMVPRLSTIDAEMDQEEVAFQFQKYSLAQAPVSDTGGRLIGMITVDDMVDVIQQENTEDLLALSNVSSADGSDTVWKSVQARAPWLGINLVTAFLVSGVIAVFEGVLSEVVQLAILMPVVAALGGNAGSQGLAVSVRAIAEREMEGPAARRAILREAITGLVNGLIFAVAVALIALAWFQDPRLAAVIGAAMLATFLWAGLSGVLIPLTLRRLGADPAVASSVFLLTMTDVIAFFSFLGLASLVLIA